VSALNGRVIATGGGAILDKANVDALKSNGILIFLDRPLKDLIPTADRPTAKDHAMLKKRYEERYDIYLSSCDIRVVETDKTEEQIDAFLDE
jgi:shikimate kinase